MSSLRGPTIFGKRLRSASITSDVSSTDSVVWVIKESFSSFLTVSFHTSSGDSTRYIPLPVAVLAHRPFHFRVPGVTDENRFFTTTAGAGDFHMHFGHQRTGGIKHRQIAAFRFVTYCLRNTVCGENQDRAVRYFANLLNKDSPRSRRLSTT